VPEHLGEIHFTTQHALLLRVYRRIEDFLLCISKFMLPKWKHYPDDEFQRLPYEQ